MHFSFTCDCGAASLEDTLASPEADRSVECDQCGTYILTLTRLGGDDSAVPEPEPSADTTD